MARKLLDDSASDSEESSPEETVQLEVNHKFAERFEHNKKREELQRLEEKHGKANRKRKRDTDEPSSDESEESSSDSEDEDDVGELATIALDSQIAATLNAIKSKDPRVYDGESTFYTSAATVSEKAPKEIKEKPMYLKDYHRENLLKGDRMDTEEEVVTYQQEQDTLKNELIGAMHAAAESDDDDDDDDNDLLVPKERTRPAPQIKVDVENADKDPETFLSNFMASRSWVPTERSVFQPFESDDEEEERRADEYEEAYNFRFEDPNKSNERLRTHARDMAASKSARREEKNVRKRKRELEKEQKEVEKLQHKEEKARLRKLRADELENKVKKIKQTAGIQTTDIRPEDWSKLLDGDWEDDRWEEEMQKRFNEEYYADKDFLDDGEARSTHKKPKFDDDIDITDIIPDFQEQEDVEASEDEVTVKKNNKRDREDKKKQAKKDRRLIEQMVDDQLRLELHDSTSGKTTSGGFRYRETSPISFGLSAREILLADDSQLNQFAGLKKLAAFRDPEKKQKDKKHLGKKARLRQWRKDTFGDEEGIEHKQLIKDGSHADTTLEVDGDMDIDLAGKSKQKKKRRQKKTRVA